MVLASGLLGLFVATAAATHLQQTRQTANPIRKVVTMLQDMDQKIREDGDKDLQMHKKYMCYCKASGETVSDSIDKSTAAVPELGENIEQAQTEKAGLDASVEKAQTDRASAQKAMAAAAAAREKEAAAFATRKNEMETNIAAINKSVAVLSTDAYGTFLQTSAAETLRKLLSSQIRIAESDRSEVLSFLSDAQSSGYAPSSGEVIGILKELGDQFTADLNSIIQTEEAQIQSYDELMAARKHEVAALTEAIERKMALSAELDVKIVTMQHDLTNAEAKLIEDQKFQKGLNENCANKGKEWEEIEATRSAELAAIADTIKLLQDDESLEMFKKTLPGASASFMQLNGMRQATARALEIVRTASAGSVDATGRSGGRRLDFLALLLQGKKVDFSKVIQMIDEMVANLKKEQVDDDAHVKYCVSSLDSADNKKKSHTRSFEGTETAITEATEDLNAVTEKIEDSEREVKNLDESVAAATEQRKAEAELFVTEKQDNQHAKELLGLAKNRLHEFYNQKLHTTTAAPQLSREDEIFNSFTFLQTAKLGKHAQHLAAAAPETGPTYEYAEKVEENNGVLAMIDLLIQDLDKDLTQSDAAEKNAQAAYEGLMSDSASMRTSLTTVITQLNENKSKLEVALSDHTANKAATSKELMAVEELLAQLHAGCDWLMKYHEQRKAARTSETESLGEAKAVLSGANYALVQTGR